MSRSARITGKPKQLLLHVAVDGTNPLIWRRLRVPDQFTLQQLHRVLQIVLSRLDYHLYEFRLGARVFASPDDEEADGEDARSVTLAALRLTVGKTFTYAYDFGDDWEHTITVEKQLPMHEEGEPDWSPRLLGGERAAPPEDVGGVFRFEEFLSALADPTHREHRAMRAWVGATYQPDVFDAWAMDHALTLAVAWGAV